MWFENILAHAHLWLGSTQIYNVRFNRWHNKYENSELH